MFLKNPHVSRLVQAYFVSNDGLILLVIKHRRVGVRELKVSKIKAYRLARLGRAVTPSFLAELLGPLADWTKEQD
jgi:hypothetical protein